MENTSLSDMATGIFRLRSDDPHMTNSTIVDLHDDAYTTLTTVEVRSGAVVLHCFTAVEAAERAVAALDGSRAVGVACDQFVPDEIAVVVGHHSPPSTTRGSNPP